MTGTEFIQKTQKSGFAVKTAFRYPYLYIRIISMIFRDLEQEDAELAFSKKTGFSISDIRKAASNCMFSLEYCTPEEDAASPARKSGEHWLKAFSDELLHSPEYPTGTAAKQKTVHFYGYKGGQGRSTTLGLTARYLADSGARILTVDADIEAPSLDIIFGAKGILIENTLLGLYQSNTDVANSQLVYTGKKGGAVSLIACRPRTEDVNIDFASFSLQTSLMPAILDNILKRIVSYAEEKNYDAVFIDHRSGMAVTTLTILHSIPGPVAIFTKLDEQWAGADEVFKEILSVNRDNPGFFVSFKPDNEDPDMYRERTVSQRNSLLSILRNVSMPEHPTEEEREYFDDDSSLEDSWILWPYDQAFRTSTSPDFTKIGAMTLLAVQQIVRLCDIEIKKRKVLHGREISPSGSSDEGDLIQTEALKTLNDPDNTIYYVFGRKGTGKTRLAKELAANGKGIPLLVDDSYHNEHITDGLVVTGTDFQKLRDCYLNDTDSFWWAVVYIGLQKIVSGAEFDRTIQDICSNTLSGNQLRSMVSDLCTKRQHQITFLMDSLETAFTPDTIHRFIASLFPFLLTLQTDPLLKQKIKCILFLRSDLALKVNAQNKEQQTAGKAIELSWNYQTILNFLLSRIKDKPFSRKFFPAVCKEIGNRIDRITDGELPEEECESLLLEIFPRNLSRSNIKTTTFIRLHFSDTAFGETSYYPRVMMNFLDELEVKSKDSKFMVTDRINQRYIFEAHEAAAISYMAQIKQELVFVLNFGIMDAAAQNQKLTEWIEAFSGQKTPFLLSDMEKHLEKTVHLSAEYVHNAMSEMQHFGMFEKIDSTRWRAGRLFKASLKMKFNRVSNDSN